MASAALRSPMGDFKRAEGYRVIYPDTTNEAPPSCPGCGRKQWLIGRIMAECAFCATALPIEGASGVGQSAIITQIGKRGDGGPISE